MQKSHPKASRLFINNSLASSIINITDRDAHYLGHVLRLKQGDRVVVFNGQGKERLATINDLSRRRSTLTLAANIEPLAEPNLELILIQALIKADMMDLVVQKAAELGVRTLYAVKTGFSVIKLDDERTSRRIAHWQKIAQSACEQSGRHRPPDIRVPISLNACVEDLPTGSLRLVFQPGAPNGLDCLPRSAACVCVLVGPEGGFNEADLALIDDSAFTRIGFGPRVLRADTAAITACSLAQHFWGDAR